MIPHTPPRPSSAASAVARRCPGTILLALFFSLLNLQCCQATLLRIDTSVNLKVDVTGKALLAEIVATNSGEEPAFHAQISVTAAGKTKNSPIVEQLPVKEKISCSFAFPLPSLRPGRYPFITVVSYLDMNQYPFSAPTLTAFTHGESSFPDLFPSAGTEHLTLSRKGTLPITLTNLGEQARDCTVWLLLPREITYHPKTLPVSIPPLQKKSARISLENFSALPGSTYPLYAVLEYDDHGRHQTSFTSATIQIEGERTLDSFRNPLLAVAGILIFIGLYLGRRKILHDA